MNLITQRSILYCLKEYPHKLLSTSTSTINMPKHNRIANTMASSNSKSMVFDVLYMIKDQNWKTLELFALSKPKPFQILSESISRCSQFNGMTLLHLCAQHDPPINLMQHMINVHPQALGEEDCLGRTPLHVAASSGASSRVIKCFVENYPQACDVQDKFGRTPLHLACDTSSEIFEDGEYQESPKPSRCPPSLGTVRILLSGSLAAVTLDDDDEMNTVEYAILSDAPLAVVKLLQKASQWALRKREMEKSQRTCPMNRVRFASEVCE
mmetsp:Transcript_27511/g.59126  ORF Transcript_27511/g.59126 Transcript_27511/m.59126 type:complete len:268 (+) Transcript_27511:53-856(+)